MVFKGCNCLILLGVCCFFMIISFFGVFIDFLWFKFCSDVFFGYFGGFILFKNLNFGIDFDSWLVSKFLNFFVYSLYRISKLCDGVFIEWMIF